MKHSTIKGIATATWQQGNCYCGLCALWIAFHANAVDKSETLIRIIGMCSLQGSIYFKRNTEGTLHKEQAHRRKLFGIGHAMWTEPRQQHTKWIVFGELLIVCLWCVFLAIHCKMFHSFVNKMFLFGLNVFVYFWKKKELWGWQNIRSHHSWELTILLIHFSVKLCVADRRTSANRENYHLLYIECKWLHTITTHSYIFYFCLFIHSFISFTVLWNLFHPLYFYSPFPFQAAHFLGSQQRQ